MNSKTQIAILNSENNEDTDKVIETCLSLGAQGLKYSYSFDIYHIVSPIELTEDDLEEIMTYRAGGEIEFNLSSGIKIKLQES